MKVPIIFVLAATLVSVSSTFAADPPQSPDMGKDDSAQSQAVKSIPVKEPSEFQKVVDYYKAYAAKIPPQIRDEVIAYRKEIARINREKRSLYKKLSQESQDYLKQEQEYKKKLPLNRKSLINAETPGDKSATEKD